jgi:K+-sensing histidine kinase KdpD
MSRRGRPEWAQALLTERSRARIVCVVAVVAPITVAALLIPGRGHLNAANDALILVVVTVVISTFGTRMAAAVSAIVSGASFDFFLTRPYGSLRISKQSDLVTEVLFVVVAFIVGELAVRSRQHQSAANEGRSELARILGVAERIADGEEPAFVLMAVAAELRDLLNLQDCRFVREQPTGKGARIDSDGSVHLNPIQWPSSLVGLPTNHVELAVRGGGRVIGTFILTPTPTSPVSHEQCMVAVALADQLGTALAAQGDSN